jgi:hypothetical protein
LRYARILLAALIAMSILLLLLQAAVPSQAVGDQTSTYPFVSLGVGGAIAALVLQLWRVDRKDSQERYERLAKESQDRYAALAKESNERAANIAADFRVIVQDNTRAVTALGGKLDSTVDTSAAVIELLTEVLKRNKPVNLE